MRTFPEVHMFLKEVDWYEAVYLACDVDEPVLENHFTAVYSQV